LTKRDELFEKLEGEVQSYVAIARANVIKRAIKAYERVFEDEERYYSNCSYVRFLETKRRNPKALPPNTDFSFIKTKIYDYSKDGDFSHLAINRRGKIEVKSSRALAKAKV
jgi:hypothetical protein